MGSNYTAAPINITATPKVSKACTQLTDLPKANEWNSAQTAEALAKLRQSEKIKARCAQDLLRFHTDVQTNFNSR